ncbi:MAG: hypothetical protein ACO3MF_04545 [Acholeplasmataceae bacterium]
MKNSIAILCRGQSLNLIKHHLDEVDEVITVNNFMSESQNTSIDKILQIKNVSSICCRMKGAVATKKWYNQYDVKKIILNVFSNEYHKHPTKAKQILDRDNISSSPLPDVMKMWTNETGGFPTTGVLAIVYATTALKKKNIYVAGMDFYETDYFNGSPPSKGGLKKSKIMKSYLLDFMKQFPNTHFTFITKSSFSSSLKNVTICND